MSQAHLIANLDRKEFLLPRAIAFDEQQLGSLSWSMMGLSVLLAASNGQGTGDISAAHKKDPDLFEAISGRWAGERVAIIGDYWRGNGGADDRALVVDSTEDFEGDRRLYEVIKAQEDGWVDISEYVVEFLECDEHLHELRNEVHSAPSQATFTIAAGFQHDLGMAAAPRSILDRENGEITAIFVPEIDPLSEPVEAEPLTDEAHVDELRELLRDKATNMIGRWDDELVERLMAAATHPNKLTWRDAYPMVLVEDGPQTRMATVWTAVRCADPTFQRTVSTDPITRETLWERVPSGPLIYEAVKAKLAGEG